MLMLAWLIGVCLLAAATWIVTGRGFGWQIGPRIGASATLPVALTWLTLIAVYVDWTAATSDARGWQLVVMLFTFIASLVAVLPALVVAWLIESRWGHAAP